MQQVLELPRILVDQCIVEPGLQGGVVGHLVCGLGHGPRLGHSTGKRLEPLLVNVLIPGVVLAVVVGVGGGGGGDGAWV